MMIKPISRTAGTILDTQVGFWRAQNTIGMIFTTSQEKQRKIIEEPQTVIIKTDKSRILLPTIVSRSFSFQILFVRHMKL